MRRVSTLALGVGDETHCRAVFRLSGRARGSCGAHATRAPPLSFCVLCEQHGFTQYSRAVSRRAGCSGPKALARAVYDYDERGPRHGSPRTRRGTRTKITLKSTCYAEWEHCAFFLDDFVLQ